MCRRCGFTAYRRCGLRLCLRPRFFIPTPHGFPRCAIGWAAVASGRAARRPRAAKSCPSEMQPLAWCPGKHLARLSDSVEISLRAQPTTPTSGTSTTMKTTLAGLLLVLAPFIFAPQLAAQIEIPTNDPPQYGPYNGAFVAGGDGLKKHMVK